MKKEGGSWVGQEVRRETSSCEEVTIDDGGVAPSCVHP